jgi:predicted aconitase with swiveling domain
VGVIAGRAVVKGTASGEALVTDVPFSFWGGYDHATGVIIDPRHPLCGQSAVGKTLCVPFTKGSSTTTNVLLQAIKNGTAPAAVITVGVDAFLALASIVADEMWGTPIPVVAVDEGSFAQLRSGMRVSVDWGEVDYEG